MAEEVWYYHHAGSQDGPVSWEKLQELAGAGGLEPSDLVWKQGMADWVEGRTIDGLFPEGAAPPPMPAGPPPVKAPKVRKPINDARDVLPHLKLVAWLLELLRQSFSCTLLDGIDKWAKIIGSLAYIGAAAFMAILLLVLAIMIRPAMLIWMALVIPLAVLLQYVAILFLDAGKTLIERSPSKLSSTAFLDCFGLVAFVGALASFCIGIVSAFSGTGILGFVVGFGEALVLVYAGSVALNPTAVNVELGAKASAGEEAISILSFLMKLELLRLIPFAFGVGSVGGLLYVLYLFFQLGDKMAALRGLMAGAPLVLGIALLPLAGYLLFLLWYLLLDLVRAVLVVPGKLDALAPAEIAIADQEEQDGSAKEKAKAKGKGK